MSYNATRFQSMHKVRNGMMAFMGIKDDLARKQELMDEVDDILDAFLTPEPKAYASVAIYPWGGRVDFYHMAKPVVIKHKRIGHRMTVTSFIY